MSPKNKSAVSVFVFFLFSFNVSGMQSLLLNTLYLLRMVHEAGKNGVEDFKPIGKAVANMFVGIKTKNLTSLGNFVHLLF